MPVGGASRSADGRLIFDKFAIHEKPFWIKVSFIEAG